MFACITNVAFHRRHWACFLSRPGASQYHPQPQVRAMASIWKGSLTFGLVHVPVEMKTAVRSDHISFRMLHAEDMSPIKSERVCQADGEPVPWSEIVKGYEYEKGEFVVLTDDDFKKAALDSSRTIDIIDFVREDEIDPRYFETPYYLLPTKGGDKPYALLREAVGQPGRGATVRALCFARPCGKPGSSGLAK